MNSKTIYIKNWDYKLSWASTYFFIGSVVNASIKTVLPLPDSWWGIISGIVGLAIFSFYLYSFRELSKRSSSIFTKAVLVFLALYFLSAILLTIRGETLSTMIRYGVLLTFAWWLPSGLFACSVVDKKVLYRVWVKASYIISFFSIIIFLFHRSDGQYEELAEYNINFGFNIILPLLIQINECFRTKKIWLFILILFEVYTIIVYANRGVLLSLGFFFVYKFAYETNSIIRKIISTIFLIFFWVSIIPNLQTFASAAVDVLDYYGVQSRSLDMLAAGVFDDTSGRDNIWDICQQMILERPITGWGLGGEFQTLTNRIFGMTLTENIASCSPHNGIVQNFVELGIVGGLISSLIVIIPLLRINTVKDRYAKILIIIFCAARVIPNLISGDGFFTEPKVAIYLFLFYYWRHGNMIKRKITA